MSNPEVSIVIPCFNQGEFVAEALESVLAQSFGDYEIIVVDDGSTDPATVAVLDALDYPKTRLLRTNNQGLASARNNGIGEASGVYILPLDADDRIGREYLEKASGVLDQHPEVGFVYCLAELFGASRGKFYLNSASLEEMLLDSRIFCSAMFRKSDWVAAGGYNPNMVYGWEDWDFWLSLFELGKKPHLIEEVMFNYRVKPESMIRSMTIEQKIAMHRQLAENHRKLYLETAPIDFERYYRRKNSLPGKLLECAKKIAFNIKYVGK